MAEQTIWPDSATPAVVDPGDSSPIEVGVKFRTAVAGTITGIRFYKAAANTGSHVGHLWTVDGTQLAAVVFTGESASGWQRATFTTPVEVTPGTTYVASYYAPAGHYCVTSQGLAAAVVSGDLTALASDASGGNGIYIYWPGGAFPASSFNATNYWVDVVFEPSAPPPAPDATLVAARGPAPRQATARGPLTHHVTAHGPTRPEA